MSSIARIGSFGVLQRVVTGTTGTKMTSEDLRMTIERCISLESFTFKDVEGGFCGHLQTGFVGRLEKGIRSSIMTCSATL